MRTNSNWIQTYTGRQFWPTDPRQEDITLEDIAHSLALKCRYAGHCLRFYSVAQHCVMASRLVPEKHALWGLMHDAAEAYLADIPRPVKQEWLHLRELENKILRMVANVYDLPWPEPPCIAVVDLILLATERRDLMARPPRPWISSERVIPLLERIKPWDSERAEEEFLKRFTELVTLPVGAADS